MNINLKKKIGAILRRFITNTEWYNRQFLDCPKFWDLNTFALDVLFIGSDSGHYGYNPSNIKGRAYDLTLRDSTILQIYEVLRNYSSYLREESATVIMTISPFDLLTGNTTYFEDRYYTILNMASIPGFAYERRVEVMSRRNNPLFHYPLMCLRKDIPTLFRKKTDNCSTTADQYLEHIKHRYSIRDFKLPLSLNNQDAILDSYTIIEKIDKFCKEHNCRFVFSFPPVPSQMQLAIGEFMNTVALKDFTEKIHAAGIEFQNHTKTFGDDPDIKYFSSELYLSKIGAEKYTQLLLNNLV